MTNPGPVSLVAERAVRLLRQEPDGLSSRALAQTLLSMTTPDESVARKLLLTAFNGDARLAYGDGLWRLRDRPADGAPPDLAPDPDRTLVFVDGVRPDPTQPFELRSTAALRLRGDEVLGACGGDTIEGAYGNRLRTAMLELLDGAIPVTHASRPALRALERWLGEPLAAPISLRRLGRERVGLPYNHELEGLVARLGLDWREGDDPLEMADRLDACLHALRRPGEPLHSMREGLGRGVPPIDWSRYAFNREFLRRIPRTSGTYRFYDESGTLLYVGKSRNLNQRVSSYFREENQRPERVQRLIDAVHRIEYEAIGSDLEAMLREAEQIRRDEPTENVQRRIHARSGRGERLRAVLILEPAEGPHVLRAFLIRDGRLLGRVPIGPRGGGLSRVRRLLDDHYFDTSDGPMTVEEGPDLDVEVVVRWLAAHRDRVVAFDPTDLRNSREVIERLRWFLENGGPFDGDGSPIERR